MDDNAAPAFEFASGALGCVEVGWTSKPGFIGVERGVARVTLNGRDLDVNLVPAQRKGISREFEVLMG